MDSSNLEPGDGRARVHEHSQAVQNLAKDGALRDARSGGGVAPIGVNLPYCYSVSIRLMPYLGSGTRQRLPQEGVGSKS